MANDSIAGSRRVRSEVPMGAGPHVLVVPVRARGMLAGDEPPPRRRHSIETGVKSWNQLCTETKPFTFSDIARGFRSWTIQSQGASSTRISFSRGRFAFITDGSVAFWISVSSASNSSSFQCPPFEPGGATLTDQTKRTLCEISDYTSPTFDATVPTST